jgi:type II secretion system protein G
MKDNTKKRKGFTLIELLVVIAIIGFLSSIVMSSLVQARMKAKDAKRRSDLVQLQLALENYYDDHGSYPVTGLSTFGGITYNNWWTRNNGHPDDWIPGLVPKYIAVLPTDPDNNKTLCLADSPPSTGDVFGTGYRYKSDGKSFKINDHCAPITPAKTNPNDPFCHCGDCSASPTYVSTSGHPNSWSICGGPIPCKQLWCGDVHGVDNSDNEGHFAN